MIPVDSKVKPAVCITNLIVQMQGSILKTHAVIQTGAWIRPAHSLADARRSRQERHKHTDLFSSPWSHTSVLGAIFSLSVLRQLTHNGLTSQSVWPLVGHFQCGIPSQDTHTFMCKHTLTHTHTLYVLCTKCDT